MLRIPVVPALVALAASSLAVAAPLHAQPDPQARIWVDGDRDLFRRGDRLQVRFSSNRDAYVAVIHVDTDGTLDFVYPSSPWDDGYIHGGRVYSAAQGRYSSWSVRGHSGIGYLYMIASDRPLDFSYFGGRYSRSWDWSYAGRNVMGDPYLALEQITRMLVPNWDYGGYSVDYYSYHVDRRHRYPTYACGYNRWGVQRGWGWTPYYGSCDRVVIFLRQYPGYYDTRRYRGDRRVYLRGSELPEVRHAYKAPARASQAPAAVTPSTRSAPGSSATPSRSLAPAERPARQRPTLERRPEDSRARPAAQRPRSGGSIDSSRPVAAPSGSSGRDGASRPAARPAPRRSGGGPGGSARPAPSPGSGGSSPRPAASPPPSGGGGPSRPAASPSPRSGGSPGPAAERPTRRGSRGGPDGR